MAQPSPPEMTHGALDCLRSVRVQLSAEPGEIRPFGSGSTLRWTITPPALPSDPDCDLTFYLNGTVISAQGTLVVQPPETTEYRIEGAMREACMILARQTVMVVTDQCIQISVPEHYIRTLLQEATAAVCASNTLVSERRQPVVEVDRRGVNVRAYFKINIENAPDPNLDVDCVIGLGVEDGSVAVSFRRFDVDLDWPRWVTIASAGISKFAEQVIEDLVERNMKPMLLGKAKEMVDPYLRMLPPGLRLYRIEANADRITIIVCPSPQPSQVERHQDEPSPAPLRGSGARDPGEPVPRG